MTFAPEQHADLETLLTAIAHSQILVAGALPCAMPRPALPAGFEDADLAVLDWIAAEARRAGRSRRLILM
jgi:hypothetical protein